MEQATSTRTIDQRGVQIFLHAANKHADAAETLWRMATTRKQGTPQAEAIYSGFCCVDSELRKEVEHLRIRGGLLHFSCAQVDHAEGEYTVRGAQ